MFAPVFIRLANRLHPELLYCFFINPTFMKSTATVTIQNVYHIYVSYPMEILYRVSMKSFPDYKHLLQENYVEYKHIFLPLLKLISKNIS
jgi:hypothetical protein